MSIIRIRFNDSTFLIDKDEVIRKVKRFLGREEKTNGGVGSGIKGHTTPKEEKEKHYTTPEEIREKQAKVNIDFAKDNYLPELNREDLEELGKESKPVILKKNVIDRNKTRHPDLTEDDYIILIQKSLYEPHFIIPANPDKKDYYHFISKINDKDNSAVIIDLKDDGENYEIVHLHKMRNKSLRNIMKKVNDK